MKGEKEKKIKEGWVNRAIWVDKNGKTVKKMVILPVSLNLLKKIKPEKNIDNYTKKLEKRRKLFKNMAKSNLIYSKSSRELYRSADKLEGKIEGLKEMKKLRIGVKRITEEDIKQAYKKKFNLKKVYTNSKKYKDYKKTIK